MNEKARAIAWHRKWNGKIEIKSKVPIKNRQNLSLAYTPGVAAVSTAIANHHVSVNAVTIKSNAVAIVTDGSRVLGLGNVGPEAALPVMEGKAVLFKELAGINAFPLCLNSQKANEIIRTVKNIAPVFGAINLEDIQTPKCFQIEKKLQNLGIPVMHDDQHGTAIVILAGLINASQVCKKPFAGLKVVVNGAGAAGNAIARLLVCADEDANICTSAAEVIVCDSKGILFKGRKKLDAHKKELARLTNPNKTQGKLTDALRTADVFIGVSKGNVLSKSMIQSMAKKPVVFALANPVPEIIPTAAQKAGAFVMATGRSDFPNQVNNALAFPGVFRGALDCGARRISNAMKLAAAFALSTTIPKPRRNYILPSVFDKRVVPRIAKAVAKKRDN